MVGDGLDEGGVERVLGEEEVAGKGGGEDAAVVPGGGEAAGVVGVEVGEEEDEGAGGREGRGLKGGDVRRREVVNAERSGGNAAFECQRHRSRHSHTTTRQQQRTTDCNAITWWSGGRLY